MKIMLAVLLAAALMGCHATPLRTDVPGPPSPAPDFALKDVTGKTVRLSDYRGKTVLLDFWATWCVPCKQSIPRYMQMQERLASKGFVLIGVDEGEKAEIVAAYAKAHGMNYPIVLDPDTALFAKYPAHSLPAAFLIDTRGNIRGRWEEYDAATGVDVELATDRLLGAPARE
jgi:peroxiredoxin